MSYLRGPLTRKQIKALMDPIKAETEAAAAPQPVATAGATQSATPAAAPSQVATVNNAASQNRQPVLPPEVSQYFIPVRGKESEATLVYHPTVLAAAQVRFSDKKIDTTREITVLAPISDGVVAVDWESAAAVTLAIEDLEKSPEDGGQFSELPGPASKAKSYDKWQKDMAAWLYRSQKVELFKSPSLNQLSNPDEPERDFRVRLQQPARERQI